MKSLKLIFWIFIALSFVMMSACSGGGGSGSAGTGILELNLTDNSTEEYRAVYITIKHVEVHLGGNENSPNNWQTVDLPIDPDTGLPKERLTVNLLELVNGVREDLGIAELETGHYTQMRLIIDSEPDDTINILSQNHPYANYVIDQSNPPNMHELKIPSGFQTGVKIVGGFDINTDQTTELILDFDACRSVVQAWNSGKWLLKPTIKIASLEDFSIINGTVTDDAVAGIEGALVSAQIFNGGTTETKDDDELIIQAATITDSNGEYKLFVTPGTYNLVVYAEAAVPNFRKVSTKVGEVLEGPTAENFTLTDSPIGTVSGDVSIMGADDEQYATLSFRQEANCADCDEYEKIEIKAINVVNGSTYGTGLPVGTYSLAASSFGYETQNPDDFPITDGGDTDVNVTF
jgi:hypothetical protein